MIRPNSAKCLGERFQDAFLAAWGQERGVAYADLPAEAQAKWNRAAVAFVCTLSDAPSEAAARITELEDENEQLRLAICGGEDAPGYAASLPLATILQVQANNARAWRDRAERAEAQCRVLSEALAEIQTWRRECHQYDADMGFSLRSFGDDDFVWIESRAAQALSLSGGGGREEKGSLPESPSADAGPYPRSHDDQRSDGEWRRPPYIFHSLSACAGCGCSGDYFPAPDAAAYEATGELYCDECAEEAVAQALGNQ